MNKLILFWGVMLTVSLVSVDSFARRSRGANLYLCEDRSEKKRSGFWGHPIRTPEIVVHDSYLSTIDLSGTDFAVHGDYVVCRLVNGPHTSNY